MKQVDLFREALVWCLEHGVKAVEWDTGYWSQGGYDGTSINPVPHLHVELDRARKQALANRGP